MGFEIKPNYYWLVIHSTFVAICSDPACGGGGTIYANGFFLFSQFWPIDIFIAEKCEWYH